MTLISRPITDLADAEAIARLLERMHGEVGRGPANRWKAFNEICHTIREEAAFIIETEEGVPVATAGICGQELFYTDAPFLADKWFYVAPEHRKDSQALRALLKEVQDLCNLTAMPCFIRIFNPRRVRVTTEIEEVAQDFCCWPAGAVIEVRPKEAA